MSDKITLTIEVAIPRKRLEKAARNAVDNFLGVEDGWGSNDGDIDELIGKAVEKKAAALVKTADVQTMIDAAIGERMPDAVRWAINSLDVPEMVRDAVRDEVQTRIDKAVEDADTATLLALVTPAGG